MRSVGRVPEESLPAYSPPRRGGALGMTASPLPKIDFPLIIVQGGRFMVIGDRIRALREAKSLSQGDIEKRSGLLRSYLSRVEHGHTVPSVETLEKLAHAIGVPLYQLFYEGDEPPEVPDLPKRLSAGGGQRGRSGKGASPLATLPPVVGRPEESDRRLLLPVAPQMAKRSAR